MKRERCDTPAWTGLRGVPPRRRGAAALIAGCLALGHVTAAVAAGPWRNVLEEDGIVVSVREEEGRPYAEFRGVGVVAANLFQLLAILDDTPRHCDWQANCTVSKVVKRVNEFERYIYHRIKAPWPVSDRDVVLRGWVEADVAKRIVHSRFRAAPLAGYPPVAGVVRMPALDGFYRLEWLGADATRVTYQVVAGTGGMLPAWLANRTNRKLPLGTLLGMRRQAKLMAGKYEAFHQRYNPDRGGTIPGDFAGGAKPEDAKAPAPKPDDSAPK